MTHVVSAARNPAMGFDHDTRLLVPIFGAAAVAAGLAAALTPRAHLWAPAAALVVAWLGLGASTLRERARLGIVGRIYRGEEAGIRLVHDADARRLAEVLPVVALAAPEVLAVEEEAASYRRNAYEGSLFVLTHDPRKTLGPLRARTRLGAACGVVSVLLVGLRVVLL
ncbi:MAG: hypothetical protein HOO96_27330 [Polyangiaceae bacterium]|nr:hypothetical protein [Polyangiaceae bacterium]